MSNKILYLIIIAFSVLLSFGTLDPIFPVGSVVNTIDIFFVLFILAFITLKFKYFLTIFFSIDFYLLSLIFILFIFGQVVNGYSVLLKPLINYKFFLCILFFLTLSKFFSNNPKVIHYSMTAFSVSCFIFSIIILFLKPELYQIIKGQLIVLEENPNSTSSRLVIAVIYIVYFIIRNPLNWGRLRFLGAILLPSLVYMIILSGSRGSLLSMILGTYMIFLLSDIGKTKKIILNAIFGIISIYIFKMILLSEDLGARWEMALEGDTAGRTDIWTTVIEIAYSNPLGVGETGYIEKMNSSYGYYIDTHNLFLYVLVCGGYISLFLFIILWIRILLKSLRNYIYNKDILPIVMFIIILFLVSKTGGVITFLLFWFIFALIKSYQEVVYNEKQDFNPSLGRL